LAKARDRACSIIEIEPDEQHTLLAAYGSERERGGDRGLANSALADDEEEPAVEEGAHGNAYRPPTTGYRQNLREVFCGSPSPEASPARSSASSATSRMQRTAQRKSSGPRIWMHACGGRATASSKPPRGPTRAYRSSRIDPLACVALASTPRSPSARRSTNAP